MLEDLKMDIAKGVNPIEDALDTTGLILDYLANWKWFLISIVVFLIGAYFYIATVVPVYQVNASVYLNNTDSQSNSSIFGANPENALLNMKNFIDDTELEILRSRNNVIHIVDSLKLAYSYWREGSFRNAPLYKDMAVYAEMDSIDLYHLTNPIKLEISNGSEEGLFDIHAETKLEEVKEEKDFEDVKFPFTIVLSQGTVHLYRAEQIPELEGTEKIIINNPRNVARRVSDGLDMGFAENSQTIVRIAYNTVIPREGVDIINTLIDFYNRQIIEDKNRSAVQTEAFILDRLIMISDELGDVEQRLQEYRQAHNISDLQLQVVSNINATKESQKELAALDARESLITEIENLIKQSDKFELLPAVSTDATLNNIILAYNTKVSRLNKLLETSTPDNPLVRTLQEDLMRSKADILQNVASVRRSIQNHRNNVAAIKGSSASQLSSLPPIDKGLQEIFREQQVKVNIYTFLLQKREEIALQKTLATPTARLIDDPDPAKTPVSPRKAWIYIFAFIIGALLPAALIFLKRMIFPVFQDQQELQRLTSVPVIGEIAVDKTKDNRDIVVGSNVTTAIAELFRLLRNNIGFTKNGAEKKVILVTSSISGEGKTFVSTNLAMTYALTGKKVVVVGLDIRRPVLAHKFGLSNRRGVTSFLSGQIDDLKTVIHKSQLNENLDIIPAGPVPPNPNELLMSDNMRKMIEQLRNDYDYVILDTAPIGIISDTLLIIRYSDIQLYVSRASYSTKRCLRVLHDAIKNQRLQDAYIVLNGVDITSGSYSYRKYGYYTRSGGSTYGYGYASGYGYSSQPGESKKPAKTSDKTEKKD